VIELEVSADAAGQRLDKWVRKALPDVPLSHIFKMLREKKVRVNGARGRAEQVLAPGDKVVIRGDPERLLAARPAASGRPGTPAPPRPVRITFTPLWQDEHLLVVDKPAGLAVHPGSGIEGATLVEQARTYLQVPDDLPPQEFKASPGHRLDRETSGVILVARTRQTMAKLTELFTEGHRIDKTYLALVKGKMPREKGTIDMPLSEHQQTSRSREERGVNMQPAITHYQVRGSTKEASLLAVTIETGRTHQIRRHLQAIGHPVLGDRRYGDFPFNKVASQRWGLRRMGLHAWKLSLPHPISGKKLHFTAPLTADLVEVLKRMAIAVPAQDRGSG
jgi:23S rRNA pseudouridine955/2504/2580 synthase